MFPPSPVCVRERERESLLKRKKKKGEGDILIPEAIHRRARNGEGRDIQFQFRNRLKEEEGGREILIVLEIDQVEYF